MIEQLTRKFQAFTRAARGPLLLGLLGLEILGANVALAQGDGPGLFGPVRAHQTSNWRIDPSLLSKQQIERLEQRYPQISSADQLEDLLRDISHRQPAARLEAMREQNGYYIRGERAPLVADIDIAMVSRILRSPLLGAAQAFVGQVDSPEVRAKAKESIAHLLDRRGYPLAKIGETFVPTDEGISYSYDIKEGDPCILARIELGFKLPAGAKLALTPGDLCDKDTIDEAIATLETDLRDDGYNQLKIELAALNFDPTTNSAVVYLAAMLGQRIRYQIIDANKTFRIGDLISTDELTNVDPTIVGPDAMASELGRRYRNHGFLDVEIKGPEVHKGGEDEFVYVYRVFPGKEHKLTNIKFEGNSAFDEGQLLDIMELKPFFGVQFDLDQSPIFNPEEIQNGLSHVRAKYQMAGYWDAKVRDPGLGQRDRDTGTVRMTVQIDEGRQRILREVSVQGAHSIPESTIIEMLGVAPGNPLDRGRLVDFQQDIRAAYMARGYLYADVQIELAATSDRRKIPTTILVSIKEGRRVRVGDIAVIGLVRTDPKVVRRELLFDTGDWYDPAKITDSRQALTKLGIFRSVQILPANRNALTEKYAELDLVVDLREAKAGNVAFGPGWSLGKGWNYGAEASYANLGGVGRQVSVRTSISEERHQQAIGSKTLVGRRIGAGYIEPWINDWPFDLLLSASQKAEWGGELWELSYGAEVAVRHTFKDILAGSQASVFYGQKIARTEGSKQVEDELIADDVRIGLMGLRYLIDRRDNLKFPTSGYAFDAELSWARYPLGGDLRYFRWEINPSIYFKIYEDWVLAFGFTLASYQGIERKGHHTLGVLPPSERLHAGGSDSVRGFRSRSLGPVVRSARYTPDVVNGIKICNPAGYDISRLNGTRLAVMKTEVRHMLTENFALTGFVDNGNVFFTDDQVKKFEQHYDRPSHVGDYIPECDGVMAPPPSIEENFDYEYLDLIKNPRLSWKKHYFAYGLSGSLLTAIGSINVAYGLPWHEPRSGACSADDTRCYKRATQTNYWLFGGEFHVNVGARF